MKNLISLLIAILFVNNICGQGKFLTDEAFIERTTVGVPTIEDNILKYGTYDWIRYVHFVKNNRLYILSYEINIDTIHHGYRGSLTAIERKIYLYSKDINNLKSYFEIATMDNRPVIRNYYNSRSVSETDYRIIMNYRDVDFYDKKHSKGSVGNVVDKGDHIEITIGIDEMERNEFVIYNKPVTLKFYPVGNGKYRVVGNEKL